MRFVCENCGFEMDYDEDLNEIVICEECGGNMYGDE
jgi:predicted nucleic acid-binding Zn ribbon protein